MGFPPSAEMIDVVCAVIRDENGRYLACKRPPGKHLGGLWEFPGGKIDAGESAEAALARELQEELGVDARVGEPLEPVVWAYAEATIRLLPFLCTIIRGELKPIEHEELRWCAVADFESLDWAEADLPILKQIRAMVPAPP
jgi:8-oxo-dGTP diphosphatase